MFNNYYQEQVTTHYSCYDQKNNNYNNQPNNWNCTIMTPEQSYYADYDREMANAVAEADYLDYYHHGESQIEQYQNQEMTQMNESYPCNDHDLYYQQEEYHYENDSLLSLIVGVQSYLEEQTSAGTIKGRSDSPLYGLQYKMYTYMRQRACDMGVQL
ncbi:hypothetical protein K501DRAFT_283393 [Backusella circina FSU 941]|nr:hypothetical protein K501DRAFT_283393 [Backusella circina FSU 941]